MKYFLIFSMLMISMHTPESMAVTSPARTEIIAGGCALLTWVVVAPALSFFMNETPMFLSIGRTLFGRDTHFRAAVAGMVAGTIATIVSGAVYKSVQKI